MNCCSSRRQQQSGNNNNNGSVTPKSSTSASIPVAPGLFQNSRSSESISGPKGGVGIAFRPDSTGALIVEALTVNGPAYNSHAILYGDCLKEIDGHDVHRRDPKYIFQLMVGSPGTTVELGFSRHGSNEIQRVRLVREIVPVKAK